MFIYCTKRDVMNVGFFNIFKLKKKATTFEHLCDNCKFNSTQIIWYVGGISQTLLKRPSTSESSSGKCDQLELLMMIFDHWFF